MASIKKNVTIDKLQEINRKGLFEKLNKCYKTEVGDYVCNDIIEAISEMKTRDKRLINKYADDEVFVQILKIRGQPRNNYRVFTEKGIRRYIHEGKLYNYKNVCEYFGVAPIDKTIDEIKNLEFERGKYDVKRVLKWLYERRKQNKALGEVITKAKLLTWLTSAPLLKDVDINIRKKNILIRHLGGVVEDECENKKNTVCDVGDTGNNLNSLDCGLDSSSDCNSDGSDCNSDSNSEYEIE
jgi:hypothetical protein